MSSYRACDPYNCSGGRFTARSGGALAKARFAGRLGALSGALALVIAGYAKRKRIFGIGTDKGSEDDDVQNGDMFSGRNGDQNGDKDMWTLTDQERFFHSGNQQHFYHSLALMAVPYSAKAPMVTTSLLASGIVLFCGTQYYRSFSKENVYAGRPLLWIGGLCLISAWFSFLL